MGKPIKLPRRTKGPKRWCDKHKREDILETIRNSSGYITDLAKHFGLASTNPIRDWIQENPDAQEALEIAKRYRLEDNKDEREKGIKTIAERIDEDPAVALRACIYFLDTHAKDRGYGKDKDDKNAQANNVVDALVGLMGQLNGRTKS